MKSEFDEMRRMLKLRVTGAKEFACRYLESRGLRFCVDYGTDNAIEKATDLMLSDFDADATRRPA